MRRDKKVAYELQENGTIRCYTLQENFSSDQGGKTSDSSSKGKNKNISSEVKKEAIVSENGKMNSEN